MNQAGRDLLRAAWLRGQPQAFGHLRVDDALCAYGVLGVVTIEDFASIEQRYQIDTLAPCPLCGARSNGVAMRLLAHLNDHHELDFAKIAELYP